MKVTAIKAQVKNADRVSVYIDGNYNFSLDQSQLLAAKVYVGKELSENELAQLKDESEFGKAYARALDIIYRRPRSVKEIRDYAWRKRWDKELAERVVEKLSQKGYLNDDAFARSWIRNRALGKPMSERKLRLELRQKGITDDIINDAMADDASFDENDALRRLVAKKRHRYDDEQKLIAYLMRQGFHFDDIKEVLGE